MNKLQPTVLLAAVALSALACGGDRTAESTPSAERPSQILVTFDAIAARRLVPFGGVNAMPRLSELAASGTIYDDAVSPINLSRPALVTMMTGLAPDRSGVRDNIHDAVPEGLSTLADGARVGGYETAAFVSTPFVSYSSGLQKGFDLFDGPEALVVGPGQHVPPVVPAATVAGHFAQWLASRNTAKPYFVWIHLADLNGLSVPLPPGQGKAEAAEVVSEFTEYDQALGKVDTALGTILDAVRAAKSARVEWTLAGTHGTLLGENGRYGDAFWLTHETLHVPLIRVPAIKEAHDPRPTWLPDVAATLAKAMGVTLDVRAEGVPLGSAPPADRARLAWGYALDDQLGWPPITVVREKDGFTTLTKDAAAGSRMAVERVRTLPPEARSAVERSGVRIAATGNPAPIPEHPEAWLKELQVARRYLAIDRPALAGRRTRALIETQPEALASLTTRLSMIYDDPKKGGASLRDKLLARYPERSDALHWSAHVSLTDSKLEAAKALLTAAMAVGPVEPEMRYDLACVLSLSGDVKGSLAELDRALTAGYRNWDWIDKDPDLALVRADRGFPALLSARGR